MSEVQVRKLLIEYVIVAYGVKVPATDEFINPYYDLDLR